MIDTFHNHFSDLNFGCTIKLVQKVHDEMKSVENLSPIAPLSQFQSRGKNNTNASKSYVSIQRKNPL